MGVGSGRVGGLAGDNPSEEITVDAMELLDAEPDLPIVVPGNAVEWRWSSYDGFIASIVIYHRCAPSKNGEPTHLQFFHCQTILSRSRFQPSCSSGNLEIPLTQR